VKHQVTSYLTNLTWSVVTLFNRRDSVLPLKYIPITNALSKNNKNNGDDNDDDDDDDNDDDRMMIIVIVVVIVIVVIIIVISYSRKQCNAFDKVKQSRTYDIFPPDSTQTPS